MAAMLPALDLRVLKRVVSAHEIRLHEIPQQSRPFDRTEDDEPFRIKND
jgi:hypothetical protein